MTTKNLLVELFVEELPPKALNKLGEAFALEIWLKLADSQLVDTAKTVVSGKTYIAFASPRRLAVLIKDVSSQATDRQVKQKLMPVSVGLDASGKATPALLKKLAALGFDDSVVPTLRREPDGKNEVLFMDSMAKGASLTEGAQKAIEAALTALPIPKVMTYQLADGWTTVNFVRPAHGLVVLHGADVIPVKLLGLEAGRTTQGHRFEAAKKSIEIKDADSYAQQLEDEGAVIASFAARRAEIERQLKVAAAQAGGTPIQDDALLDEVTALVERPNVLIGQFEPAFLEVPQECLILTMKANQKYFPLLDAGGKLTNKFLIVSNIRPADASAVVGGNERVVRPRLADAKFFFDQDRKKSLLDRIPGLAKVVYHNKLGTQGERSARVAAIASAIGQQLGGEPLARQADQAANHAKADLLTDMVGEFPELQGIMGRYYALHDGLSTDIADAIEDHYKPRFAGDSLPRNRVGLAVALADKLETLVGMFAIGQIPTGDKDPFALRRHALGVIRMLTEVDIGMSLMQLVTISGNVFSSITEAKVNETRLDVLHFIHDRYAGLLREGGYSPQEIESVLSVQFKPSEVLSRLTAVRAFAALPESASLAAANKRVGNILKKVEGGVTAKIDTALLKEPAEIALNNALSDVKPKADAAFAAGDYTASLQALAVLRGPVDTFFNDVMVNAEDTALRNNRLGLLATLHEAMNRVADLSKLST